MHLQQWRSSQRPSPGRRSASSKRPPKARPYYRVSTQRQGRSGLGLEAQQRAVRDHLDGGRWRLIAEITEIETGKRADRPKLSEALKLCRVHGATLVIAKLDRLARNVAFVSALMDAGVEFEAVDFPQANRLTIHIMAAVAEHEAKAISDRTKAALASAKARGVSLGEVRMNHKPFTAKARAKGPKVIAARALERAADLAHKGGQEPIVHLEADLHATIAWAQANNRRWAFTLSNAGAYYFEDRSNVAQLGDINWDAVQARRWSGNGVSRSVKEGKQAEFLIERAFPWRLVERIGVYSPVYVQPVSNAMKGAAHRPMIEIKQDWYY
jgi:DNA invertase Pin-like site-specific DNA recombinase